MVVALLHGELERLEAERLPCLDLLGMLGLPASAVDQAQGLRRKRQRSMLFRRSMSNGVVVEPFSS